jgi:hypothetical protein
MLGGSRVEMAFQHAQVFEVVWRKLPESFPWNKVLFLRLAYIICMLLNILFVLKDFIENTQYSIFDNPGHQCVYIYQMTYECWNVMIPSFITNQPLCTRGFS